jgi:thiosulfate reductase/polysulfide reductase chain A
MAKKLAETLGLGHYYPWKDIEEYFDHRLTAAGLSLAELKERGIIRGASQPIFTSEGAPLAFPTPSGKIEFYSPQLAEAGFDPVPVYHRPAEPPPGSFRLLFGRSPVHSFSRTQSNRVLSDMMDENEVWINADIARRLELKSGDYVRLRNQDEVLSNRIRVKATERIRPDCVYMVHGFGHTAKGMKHAFQKGASDAQLVTRYATDPLMGGTGMHVNFVTIEPAEVPRG